MTLHLFGLLTRIRLTGRELDLLSAARQQYLFPLIGIVVGLIASLAIIALDFLLGPTNALVSGSLVLVFLYCVTGIMHTEGLADLADAMMTSGDADRKRGVMKDPHVGVAAVLAASMFLIVFFALLTRMCAGAEETSSPWPNLWAVPFVLGMVVSEVAGKLSMNTAMFLGPSSHKGMGQVFVENATSNRFAAACAIAGTACFILVGWLAVLVFAGVFAGAAVTVVARKHIGGVSGDVFGAANEVGRLLTLTLWVGVA